ncbi:MAG TPA: DUF262 domain-containing protein [Enteractinococcus sp.]
MLKSLANDKVYSLLNPENNIVFKVPKYQREYTWGKAEWDDLVDDLLENNGSEGHFLGTIICVNSTANTTEESILEVIDGQQRLTTLSLLLIALYSILNDHKDDMELEQQVDLINLQRMIVLKDPVRPRIRPQSQNRNDEDYEHVIAEAGFPIGDPMPPYSGNRRIKRAYKHFIYRIEQLAESEDISLVEACNILLAHVKGAHVVKLEVVSHADAFTLFESLNNRGVPLTPIDLIKNTLLATAERTPDISLDQAYSRWSTWLEVLGDEYSTQERFFRYYYNAMKHEHDLVVPGQVVATRSNLIRIYETLIQRDLRKLVTNLDLGIAAFSQLLGDASEETTALTRALTRLRNAQGMPAHILLIYLLITRPENQLSDDQLVDIVDLQTSFFVRRNLTGKPPTNALVRLYMELVSTLRESPLEEWQSIILTTLRGVSASDEDFYTALTGPVYDLNSDVVRFILTYLAEQHMTRENYQDLWQRTQSSSRSTYVWSIEHILPQGDNLPSEWVEMLGGPETASAVQQRVVHHLGNLTITGYNSSLSNASFARKRDHTDPRGNPIGYRNGLSLNTCLADLECWDEDAIIRRTKELADQTMAAFPLQY